MAKFPSLPLFTDAIMSDCGHLTDDEFGLYMRILIVMWRSPGCKIPSKAEWLEKRFRRPIVEIGPLLTEFCICDGNFWEQGRLTDEYAWVKKNSKRQSVRAKSRWNKGKHASHDDADVQSHIDAPHPTPPIPDPIEPKGSITPISPQEYFFEGNYQTPDMLFEIFWNEYPSIRPKGNKQEARTKFLKIIKEGESYERLIEGTRKYAEYCTSTDTYNKDASVFLNPSKHLWRGDWEAGSGRGKNGGGTGLQAIAEGIGKAIADDE